ESTIFVTASNVADARSSTGRRVSLKSQPGNAQQRRGCSEPAAHNPYLLDGERLRPASHRLPRRADDEVAGSGHPAADDNHFRIEDANQVRQREPQVMAGLLQNLLGHGVDRKSTRLNSSHVATSYAVFC